MANSYSSNILSTVLALKARYLMSLRSPGAPLSLGLSCRAADCGQESLAGVCRTQPPHRC